MAPQQLGAGVGARSPSRGKWTVVAYLQCGSRPHELCQILDRVVRALRFDKDVWRQGARVTTVMLGHVCSTATARKLYAHLPVLNLTANVSKQPRSTFGRPERSSAKARTLFQAPSPCRKPEAAVAITVGTTGLPKTSFEGP